MDRPALRRILGVTAMVAPALHTLTDVIEWRNRGFSEPQLWLNLIAFLPMPFLLLGLHAAQRPKARTYGLVGAWLYGAAFAYFTCTTIYALVNDVPDYDVLWKQLGPTYTFFGAVMVAGGMLFAGSALRAGWFPRTAVILFLSGILANLLLALLPAPDILQTIGSALRNCGLIAMGYATLRRKSDARVHAGTPAVAPRDPPPL